MKLIDHLFNFIEDRSIGARHQREAQQYADFIGQDLQDVEDRLHQLRLEWSTDDALKAQAALLAAGGLVLAMMGRKRWLALPVLAGGLYLQNKTRPWNFAYPGLRRMGYRTRSEIEAERELLEHKRYLILNSPSEGTTQKIEGDPSPRTHF